MQVSHEVIAKEGEWVTQDNFERSSMQEVHRVAGGGQVPGEIGCTAILQSTSAHITQVWSSVTVKPEVCYSLLTLAKH